MKVLRERTYLFALLALLLVFAGCKGESPTAPTPTSGGGGPTTGGNPPSGVTINLSVSNPTPLVNSTSTITATVTANNSPVPNGTAVEFATNLGQFQDSGNTCDQSGRCTTIRTTNNGVASAVLSSGTAGPATVVAVVNNVTAQTTITFQAQPTTPPPVDTAMTVTGIAPTTGRPEGGETVTINGTNFRTPVRVLFVLPSGETREGLVTSVTPTAIQVITPSVNLAAGQTLNATVTVFNEAGTPNEQHANAPAPFVYRLAQLTPHITTVSPDNGPISGGTRITIFGDGFEAPTQVSFGTGGTWTEMQVINITFNQIIAITPTARDVMPNGSGTLTGPVDLRVININSATNATLNGAFRYLAKMQITNISPQQGTALGGTRVTIDGVGFDDPVAVSIGGVPAQPVRVTGTQVIAVTSALASPCGGGSSGAVVVTNINNGDFASSNDVGMGFTYISVKPIILSIASTGAITPGSTVTITVQDPGVGVTGAANIRFTIGTVIVTATPSVITTGIGNVVFTAQIPSTFTFSTQSCTAGGLTGTQFAPLAQTLTFTNLTTGCTDTLPIVIEPPAPNPCLIPPTASATPGSGTAINVGTTAVGTTITSPQTITITNAANPAGGSASNLTLSTAITGPGSTDFSVTATSTSVAPGASSTLSIHFTPTVAGARGPATLTITTNDPAHPTFTYTLTGTGT